MTTSRRGFLAGAGLAGAAVLGGCAAMPGGRSAPKGAGPAKRVVLISLDGIRTDGLKQAKTPNLDALFAEGVFSNTTRDVMPSATLPNWTTLLCGVSPEQHGVTDNGWTLQKHRLDAVVRDARGYIPSVFSELKRQIPSVKTAFYWNWKPLINPYNPESFDEAAFEEKDGFSENYDRAFRFLDAHRAEPALVFLYDVHTDHAGHRHKWMSPQYIRAIEEADEAVGGLVARLKAAGLFADAHFLFLTDHGGVGYGHGGVSPEEMIVPWGIAGPGVRKGFDLRVNDTVNTAPTLLRLFGAQVPEVWTGRVADVFEG